MQFLGKVMTEGKNFIELKKLWKFELTNYRMGPPARAFHKKANLTTGFTSPN